MCNSDPDSTRPPGPATDSPPPRQWHQATVAQRGCAAGPRHHDRRERHGRGHSRGGRGGRDAGQLSGRAVARRRAVRREAGPAGQRERHDDRASIIAERRTPYDRGRDHPALGNIAFRSLSSRDRSVHLFRPLWSTTCPGNGFPLRSSPPAAAGRRAVPRPAAARRRAGAAGTRCSRSPKSVFTFAEIPNRGRAHEIRPKHEPGTHRR